MKKTLVINPVRFKDYNGKMYNTFVEINLEEKDKGRALSITGVESPMSSGNCRGSCGQIVDRLMDDGWQPAAEWTEEDVNKLVEYWNRWHLNDMNAACEHQRELGWADKIAGTKVNLYHFLITNEASHLKREAEKSALLALSKGETFTPTAEQIKFSSLDWGVKHYENVLSPEINEFYNLKETETKTLGWLYEKDHPDGILCKPCPVCGYKYGSSWLYEEIPQEVIDWLFSRPETKVNYAWV